VGGVVRVVVVVVVVWSDGGGGGVRVVGLERMIQKRIF
jgi:hypothetical protein